MCGSPPSGDPQDNQKDAEVAGGGPAGVSHPTYAEVAARLVDNGYEPVPIVTRSKSVAASGWTDGPIDTARVEGWCRQFGTCGVGLRTGRLVGLDIDVEDPDVSYQLAARAEEMFGGTLIRVGRWPRRLLLFCNMTPIRKLKLPRVDILGVGQQLVAFGIHPDTGLPYEWVTGESPCEVPFDQLPLVDEAGIHLFLAEAAASTAHLADERRPRRDRSAGTAFHDGPTRNRDGLVIDGRDGWLSTIAFHAVHDALDVQEPLDPERLAVRAWDRFAATTDLGRPQKDGRQHWSPGDAAQKIRDKLGLHAAGRLPRRDASAPEPEDPGNLLPPTEARARLSEAIAEALDGAETWLSGDRSTAAPVMGIRATVGLGKSAISREQIAAWMDRMVKAGLPHRVLVLTPSHVLAEEAAADWAAKVEGMVAVLRGYEAHDRSTGEPMCRDTEMVKWALRDHLLVGKSVCYSSRTWHCPHYEGCLKLENKSDVAAADVVLAPYDVLFTGFWAGERPFGLMVIDEGCWQRAENQLRGPSVETFARAGLSPGLRADDADAAAAMADLAALRSKAQIALGNNRPGEVMAAPLRDAGLSARDCEIAASLEERCIVDPGIYPGMKAHLRKAATNIVRRNIVARSQAAIWRSMAEIIADSPARSGLLRILPPDPETDQHRIVLHDHHRIAQRLDGLPILHLDATLRPDLAKLILPGLEVTRIEADQPHLNLTLVVGRFGKTTFIPSPDLAPDEMQRRQNRLREFVDHVRWEARRVAPGKVLVVTHHGIEAAFAGIRHVQTAHFNAIAGLDQYRDVRLLIIVGRPLPSSEALTPLTASFFHHLPEGGYRPERCAVRLRTGGKANLRLVAHEDPQAEVLRAAICDDEVIQAIGRGRGVNRTADNPLEVQVMADVALPLVHDAVLAWDMVKPDVFQRMLLAGIAVDSPADAVLLHAGMFASADAADSVFRREAFNRQNPIGDTYREMTVKSARYRRGGRGRSWQRCWWIDGDADVVRARMAAVLGLLDGWEAG
jgi:hypothetical protein